MIAAVALSRVSVVIDHSVHLERRPGVNLPSDAETMTVVASTIAAAMLTFLAAAYDELATHAGPDHAAVLATMRAEFERSVDPTPALPDEFATTADVMGLG